MSVGRCTMSHMNALAALGMLLALAAGTALGWLLHAARSGDRAARAEAQLVALRENEALLQQSLGAVSEDSARRHLGAIGEQISRLVAPLHEAVGALAEQALNNDEVVMTSLCTRQYGQRSARRRATAAVTAAADRP
ncbi:hypothetical protein M2275_003692 [Rhodococcus opacus]|nr:hypothetical protein [Rhodococcus opacus]